MLACSSCERTVAMFEIQPQNPELFRQQTRRSTLFIALIFLSLAMLLSSAAVLLFGVTPAWPEVLLHCGIAALVCVDRRSSFWKGSSCN